MIDKDLLSIFNVLDLEPDCNKNQIKKAYKKKAKLFHPDLFVDVEDKKIAEKEFMVIKKAYDFLMSLDDTDFDLDYQFDKYNIKLLEDEKNKNANFNEMDLSDQEKEAINYMESMIKNTKINMFSVFECIRKNKMIFPWNIASKNTNEVNGVLVKEALYRRIIKKSKEYKSFLNKHHFYRNIDIHATLRISKNYLGKEFNEELSYEIKKVCDECNGDGCNKCNNGIINTIRKIRIKVPLSNSSKFYEIKESGHSSPLGDGKLILTIIRDNKRYLARYKLDIKNNFEILLNPALDAIDYINKSLKSLNRFVVNNKLISIMAIVILLLIITIICLVVLL